MYTHPSGRWPFHSRSIRVRGAQHPHRITQRCGPHWPFTVSESSIPVHRGLPLPRCAMHPSSVSLPSPFPLLAQHPSAPLFSPLALAPRDPVQRRSVQPHSTPRPLPRFALRTGNSDPTKTKTRPNRRKCPRRSRQQGFQQQRHTGQSHPAQQTLDPVQESIVRERRRNHCPVVPSFMQAETMRPISASRLSPPNLPRVSPPSIVTTRSASYTQFCHTVAALMLNPQLSPRRRCQLAYWLGHSRDMWPSCPHLKHAREPPAPPREPPRPPREPPRPPRLEPLGQSRLMWPLSPQL
jgi:hypothetical protein